MADIRGAFFVVSVVLLVFLGLSAPTIEPGSSTFVIAVLSAGMLLVTLVGSAVLIYVDWDPFEKVVDGGS